MSLREYLLDYGRSWRHHGVTQAATLSALFFSFGFFLVVTLIAQNFYRLVISWGGSPELTVYVADGLGDQGLSKVERALAAIDNVAEVKYVSAEDAYENFRLGFESVAPEFFSEEQKGSIFPASFILKLNKSMRTQDEIFVLSRKAQVISSIEGVEDVSYGQTWVDAYASFTTAVKWGVITFLLLLFAAGQFMISNSIRASIDERRDEIKVKELLGADRKAIRGPFLFEGWLTSLVAGALSLVSVWVLYFVGTGVLAQKFPLLTFVGRLEFFSLSYLLGFLLLFSLVGLFGSYAVVRRVNSGWLASHDLD